ncbi:MAG: hypothetical protein JW931_06955 [Methanomicrobiaceae archaeon]|nr:hypothetical protein [Methanomicrobiaceae archaeon]
MGNSFLYGCLTVLLLVSVAICGCSTDSFMPESASPDVGDVTVPDEKPSEPVIAPVETAAESSQTLTEEPVVESLFSPARSSDYYLYPEAYEKFDIIYFDKTSGRHSTKNSFNALFSAEPGDMATKNQYVVVDMGTGKSVIEKVDPGKKYMLQAVKMAPVGDTAETLDPPAISDFLLIDGSETYNPKTKVSAAMGASVNADGLIEGEYIVENVGDVYSGRTIYGTLFSGSGVRVGEQTGWLVFEVPESFKPDKDTYLKMNFGDDGEVYWHLSYLRADVSVKKSPSTGNIEAVFSGGSDAAVVRGIEIVVTEPDGTVKTALREIEGDESRIPEGTKLSAEGSAPGEGTDHVIVYLIRMDGEKFVKYESDLAVESSAQ